MKNMKFDRRLTDEIYTSDTVRLGEDAFQAMQETIYHNGGVGTITGYYDAELSILSVSNLLLHNLNHSYESLMEQTKASLKNLSIRKMPHSLTMHAFVKSRAKEKAGSLQQMALPSMCVSIRRCSRYGWNADLGPVGTDELGV